MPTIQSILLYEAEVRAGAMGIEKYSHVMEVVHIRRTLIASSYRTGIGGLFCCERSANRSPTDTVKKMLH